MEAYFRMKYFMDFIVPLVIIGLFILVWAIVIIKAEIECWRRKRKKESEDEE